ncbi:MAG: VWA domain-containing protein, partial [Planctomycetales bacterium]|nr:VWA domain-containing protein [Planctomycetales bacterium]
MTLHCRIRFAVFSVFMIAAVANAADSANMLTYADATGDNYYALSLQPNQTLPSATSHDVLILVDTSASQIGAYRDDSLEAARTLINGLTSTDRVHLAAVDLKVKPMTDGFVTANSKSLKKAFGKLVRRVPLGSTDLVAGLKEAVSKFDRDHTVARRIVYIGDGASRADFASVAQMKELVQTLSANRVSVSSYAIGPERDIEFLAALANNTGGQLYIDAESVTGQQAGSVLANAARVAVLWPTASNVTKFGEAYPAMVPLRADRDSVIVGKLSGDAPESVTLTGKANGTEVKLAWNIIANPNEDYGFLPTLVSNARKNDGASLATVGMAGLDQVRRIVAANAQTLTQLSAQALSVGNKEGAKLLAEEAIRNDPAAPMAESLKEAATESEPESKLDTAKRDTITRNTQITIGDDDSISLGDDDIEPLPAVDGDFVDSAEVGGDDGGVLRDEVQRRRITETIVKTEVNQGISDAQEIMRSNPDQAIVDLKALIESVRQVPDLDASVRSQLLNRLETSVRQGGQAKLEKDKRDELQREQVANSRERARQLDLAKRQDEILQSYVEQFNSRLDERRYPEAVDVGDRIRDEKPNTEIGSAFEKGRAVASYERMVALRRDRQQAVLDTLYQVEVSFQPFPDEPPLVYPEAEKWIDLTHRRKKYAQVDFADTGTTQQKILDELNEPTRVDFVGSTLQDAVDYLKELHEINIELDTTALDELGVNSDVGITDRTLSGMSLKSALKLILSQHNLTYVVEDGYLQITTPDKAAGKLVTKVYPVADLVLPIQSMGGGMMGGMMGGGMMGGMGGGMGG